jgi:hypothetical protein
MSRTPDLTHCPLCGQEMERGLAGHLEVACPEGDPA